MDSLSLGSDPVFDPVSDPACDRASDPTLARGAWCRCGESLPADGPAHRCVESLAALEHTDRVAMHADLLVNRLIAARALGTLAGEPRPLSSFAGGAPA